MWTPREEVSVKEDLPEIEDADASRELEPLAMGRMSAPSSWSTRRGVALQTQGAMPPDDDEDLRHPQDVGQGQDLRYPQDAGQGRCEVHPQGVDLRHPQDVGQGQRAGHPQGVDQFAHPQGVDLRYPQDAGQGQHAGHHQGVEQQGHHQGVEQDGHHRGVEQQGHHQGVEQAGHHRGVAAGLLAGEVQRSGKGHGQGRVVQPNGMGGEIPSHGVGKQGGQTGGLGGEIPVQRSDIMQEAGHHRGVSREGPSRPEVDVQWTGRHRGVSHGYGPERRQVQGHRTVPSGLRDQSQRRVHRRDDGSPLERVPMGVQQYEMRRQMPREASRQPQGEVRSARNFVDDINQQGRDERDELKRALEQSMVEELHRQKLEMEKQQAEMKKYAEDLQRQRDEFEKKNEELQKELKKKSSSVDPPRTPPRRPQYYSLSPRTTPGGTQVPPGQPPLEVAELPELPPWQFDPFAVDEHVGGGTGFDGLEDFWTPVEQQPQQQHRPRHGADRFAWLDREVRMMHGERPRLTGEYWEQPVHRHGGPPADFGYVTQPPPQPPQGHGVGPSAAPVYAAPMQNGSVPLQWQQPQPQAKGPDGEASEMLRNVPITLPTLKDVSEPQAALRAGDWLSELMPLISDVSEGARVWWNGLVQRAQDAYATWLTAGPMDRMAVQPDLQVENKYVRLESRVLSMLLAAVPQTVKQEAISLREMTCVQLVFRILKLYQPGGLNEKNTILDNLTQTTAAKSAAEAGEMLRQWRRQLLRARELGLHVPDPLLQVSALSEVMRTVIAKEHQASFRISNFRMTHMVDVAPTQLTAENYLQMLIAEADHLHHGTMTKASPTSGNPKINVVNAAGDKGGGKKGSPGKKGNGNNAEGNGSGVGAGACKHWGSHYGCLKGDRCTYAHEWNSLNDKEKRCWKCSSLEHIARDCTAGEKVMTSPGDKSSKGSPKGKGKTKDGKNDKGKGKDRDKPVGGVDQSSKDSQPQVAQIQQQPQVAQIQQQPQVAQTQQQPQVAQVQQQVQPSVMGEVASLLKTMRTTSTTPRVLAVVTDNNQGVLLDSGATHILRGPYDETEWMQAIPTEVQTATGKTQLRMSKMSRSLLTKDDLQPIVPLGMLTQHGCKMRWHRDGCALTHAKLGEVKVTVRDNCPYVTNDVGLKLIRELETAETNKRLMLRSLEVTGWKQEDKDMADKLKKLFPETPVELLQPMVSKAGDEARLPWNRHQRRRFKKAKGIVLNLFSGPDQAWWSKRMPHDIEVVNVDLLRGQDFLDSAVWHFLLQFVRSGRVVAVLAGPPCRTVSAARYRSDGGPRPVRSRHGLQRFGLDTNTMMEQQLADTDSQLWLRTLLLMYEAKLYNPDVKAVVETPEDPMTYRQDEVEYASFTVWPEVKSVLEKAVGLTRLTVDQGALGHQRRKPTCLWSNMDVIKALDGLKDDTKHAAWPDSLSRAMELSKSTAAWAPTLKDMMIREIHAIPLPQLRTLNLTEEESWYLHLMSDHIPYRKDCLQCQVGAGRDRPRRRQKFQSTYEMSVDLAGPFERAPDQGRAKARYFMVATVKVPWLAEIGALVEGWKPKPRPEGFPDLEALLPEVTLDPDPFKDVEDVIRRPGRPKKVEEKYDVQASDPSKGGAPDSSKGGAQVEVVEVPQNGVQCGDVHVQDCRDGGAQDDEFVKQLESCPLPEVPLQVLEKNPPEVDVNAEDVAKQEFQNKMAELQDVNVKPITFAVPVSDRCETTIINAVASLYTRFRALQVPIYRVRVDRAKELVSQRFRTWASARNLEVRVSPGDEPTQNSTAEIEIQVLKNVTRTLLQSSGLDVSFWPLALRQAAEQRSRRQLSVLGLQLPALLPFGVWGVVRKKTWANRGVPLKYPKQRVRILGPSADMSPTSGEYWVVDERGNGFRTTVVSVPTKSAEMGSLHDLNPGQAPLPDDDQQPDGEQLHEQLPESPGYEPSILEDDAPGPGEDLEFEDMQRLVDGSMEVELQEVEEHAADLPWPLPPLLPPPRVRGKQPPAVRGLMSSAYQQCNGCGLQQPRLNKCHFCHEPAVPAGGEWTEMDDDEVQDQQDGQAQDEDVHQLQQLCKDEMAVNHLVKGMSDLWNEERYMLAQAEEGQDVNELAKYVNSIHSQLMKLQNQQQQQLTSEIDKMVLGEEEKVLQTYTVAAKEVRAEADKWKPAIKEEIDNLLSTNTIVKMSKEEVASLESSGMALEKIPGKLVATRKAPLGRRRARIVACGNFVHGDPLDADSDVAAGGVDGIAIRLLVKLAAEREWCLKSIDVKAAFLQAPKRSVKTRTTLVQPPRLLVELGLAQQGEWWSVQGALYGLVESPKDWSVHRDQELPLLRWSVNRVQYKLVQTEELHLWMVTPVEMTSSWKPGSQGCLATYVDDFLVGAPQEQADAMLEAVQRRWTCSSPEMVTEGHQMKFCGYEIAKVKDGFFLHQCGYLKDVLKRHGMEAGMAPVKNLFANLGEDDTEEVQTEDLRRAQQVIGELQWLVTRTRPDVVYHVGVMARLAHRRARHVVKLGDELLRYLSATCSKGLHYMKTSAQKPYGRNDELATQVSINNLEVFVDASHALEHENYKSVTGVILCVGGSPIAWASGRQPFVTTSTAESELVSCGEGFQCGESLAALLEVMGVGDINKTLNCDSKSALHLCTNDTGSWRTRHLRIRYARLREAFQDELSRWCARHVSGLVLPADGATKPLQGPKMDKFVDSIYLDDLDVLRRAEDELRSEEEIVVRLLTTGQTLMETDDSQCQETGLGLIVAACWMMKKRERENEPSPPWSVRENEPTDMEEANARAPNEPALRHEGRENEPPRRLKKTMVRAPNEPTMQEEGRENEPPHKSQKEAMKPSPKGMIDVEGKRNFRVSNMERSLSAEYYPQRDQVSSPQRSSQTPDHCPSGCHGPQLRALQASHGKRGQQQGPLKRRQGDGHGFNCNLVGRAEQWHGLEGDPIEDLKGSSCQLRFRVPGDTPWRMRRGRQGVRQWELLHCRPLWQPSNLQNHLRNKWMRRSRMGAMSWLQKLWMKNNPHRRRGKCRKRASMVQWLCPHQVEMEMIPAEIVETDVNQNETMGRNLHQLKKMRMKKNIQAEHVQLWTSRGREWLGQDPLDIGFGDEAEAPSMMWRRARMGRRSLTGC